MAGLGASLRPQPPSSASAAASFAAKLLLLLTLLPLSLALFAFVLQWRGGGVDDPISRWSPEESRKFPGMDTSPLATVAHLSQSSDCSLLGRRNSATFPYYRDWKFNFESDLKPKVSDLLCCFVSLSFFSWCFGVWDFFAFNGGLFVVLELNCRLVELHMSIYTK